MKYAYLTIDIEEWYELEYLKDYDLEKMGVEVVPKIFDFLDMLDELNIKATFFIVAELMEKYTDIIRDIAIRGHAIGCHGLDHILLYEKDNVNFLEEIKKAKELIETKANCTVNGYRAACFSMERDKLELVRQAGYKYDSSKILFKQHPLYRNLDMSGYDKVDDLVYVQDGFIEYETPTLNIGKFDIPFSGGGYLRLFPFWLIKKFIKKYEKQQKNMVIYIHPFELTNISLPFPKEVGFKDKFRASVGRKNNLKKLKKVIMLLKDMGSEFKTFDEDIEIRVKMES
jgi:polysaccharide deacetylase family protein (PEP-CTERM system associated)